MKNLTQLEQMILPLKLLSGERLSEPMLINRPIPNADLIGRCFDDGATTITVFSVCPANPNQVMVKRDPDGQTWSAPAWLIRVVTKQKKKRRAA
jgi:hypothetical protein